MSDSMRVLLIGPQPPPHGGISVHVRGIQRQLSGAGIPCRILDTTKIRHRFTFLLTLVRYALSGWTLHLHTNGHNRNSWLLAFLCGVAGQIGKGSILTLHSGMAPDYVFGTSGWRRRFIVMVCRMYRRIVCVAPEIRDAVMSLGVSADRTEGLPAWLGAERGDAAVDPLLSAWLDHHQPILSSALFFRPEYGFECLAEAVARLRQLHPKLGCVVMGSGEQFVQARQSIEEAGLHDHVLLAGDVSHETCLEVISRSHVFLRPTFADGDSISVREALALGVAVVASRVGTRPPGTMLFRAGDVDEMIAQIERAISAGKREILPSGGGAIRLLETYRQVQDEACASG